jgi:nucleotide-binding universal stress UspA family protein
MPFKKILVPLDGGENSEIALSFVTGLAVSLGAELVLLAVVDPHGVPVGEGVEADRAEKRKVEDELAAAKHYLEARAGDVAAKSKTLKVSQVTATGKPAETIIEQAKKAGADMVAMSTHRDRLIERGILGSVTDTVLRTSPVPVLAVRPDGTRSFTGNAGAPNVIIVPLDGSELAEEAVPVALEIAELCSSEVVFVRTVHLPSYAVSGPGAEFYDVDFGVGAERKKADAYLAQFVKMARERGLKARTHAALGSAAARIIEETVNAEGALVVISSHGRGGFRRMVLGSVADKVVRASRHPVLVLRHQA